MTDVFAIAFRTVDGRFDPTMSPQTRRAPVYEPEPDSGFVLFWRYSKIGWTAFRNLLTIGLLLIAFQNTSTKFEAVVLCLLVLVLQSVNWGFSTFVRFYIEESLIQRSLLVGLYEKFSDPEVDQARINLSKVKYDYQRTGVFWYVNIAGGTAIYFIVIWNLLSVLVLS